MRSSIQRLALTLLLLGTSPVRVVAQEQELDPLVRQVIQALEEQESQISTLSVEVKAVCLNNYAKFLETVETRVLPAKKLGKLIRMVLAGAKAPATKRKRGLTARAGAPRSSTKHSSMGKSGMYLTTEFSPVLGSHSLSAQESMQLQGLTISPRTSRLLTKGN